MHESRTAVRPEAPPLPVLLTSREVATALQVSQATLCRWRQTRHGQRVVWLSPYARYRPEEVTKWLEWMAA